MSEPLRYIINEQGDRVGVLLDVEDYQRLTNPSPMDPELLVGLSQSELLALAQSALAPVEHARLDDLLARHAESELAPHESAQLDALLEQVDQLNLLKTRARYTLTRRNNRRPPYECLHLSRATASNLRAVCRLLRLL